MSYRIGLFLLLFTACRPDLEDKRALLEEELGQEGKARETLSRIDLTIQEANRERSRKLSDSGERRKFYPSLDGRTMVYSEGNRLFSLRPDQEDPVQLDLPAPPVHLLLSGAGDAAIALSDAEPGNCRFTPLSFRQGKIFDSFQQDCLNLPALTDQLLLFTVRPEGITGKQMGSADAMHLDMPPPLPLSAFPPKYKKIKNKFVLFSLPDNSILIFFGKAGYYDLYHYPGFGATVRKILSDVARPQLDGEVPFFHIQTREEEQELKLRPVKNEYRYFVLRRVAGRFELTPLTQKKEGFKTGKGIRMKPMENLTYLGNEQAFLQPRRNLLAVWKPGKPYRYLPLISKTFSVYQGGIVYEDHDRKLYLRKSGFGQTELDLLKLKFDAENMAEADRAQEEAEKAKEAAEEKAAADEADSE
ncbi:MAG: hypothetical protein HS115_18755 [Spirochaetales bacterium]|nr:hypothetical protein [Spirochaetales bacterium]